MLDLSKILLYFILPIAIAIYFFLKKKYSYFEELGIPHMKPQWPMGNVQGIGSKYHLFDIVLKMYEECKGKGIICGFYNFIQPVYVVIDPELAKNIFIKDFNNFVNRGTFVNEEDEPLTAHLFNIENDRWRYLRNKLSPAFTSGKLKGMYPIIINKGDNLVARIEEQIKENPVLEVKNLTNRFTVDIISSVSFGMESNTLKGENERLLKIFREVFGAETTAMLRFFFLMAFPKLSKKLKIRQFSKDTSDFFMNVVGTNIKHREMSNDNRSDFLNMLIQLKNKGSIDGEFSSEHRKLTLNQVMAQAFLFFFAGADTSSTAVAFCLTQLGSRPAMQEKLRTEILDKIKENKGEILYESVMELTYLNQVVNETLRMYTPGFIQIREALNDFKVPGTKHTIPAGSSVWINSIGMHYDEKYYQNPKEFDPERFSQEEIAKRPSFTFLPFGEGPRNCIGMRIGLLNMKLALIFILKNFKLTTDPSVKFPIVMDPKKLNTEPMGGFKIKFEKIAT